MANLKINGVIVATETAGNATLQSGIIAAKDGTSSVTIANSTGAVTTAGPFTSTGAATLSSTLAVTGTTTLTGAATLSSTLTVGSVSSHMLPTADDTSDLGSSTKRWQNIYTTDLHLNNDRGDWTIIEEEEYLSIKNNKNGKMYKFVLEEIE